MRHKRRVLKKLIKLIKKADTPTIKELAEQFCNAYKPSTYAQLWSVGLRVLVGWEAAPGKQSFQHAIVSEIVHTNTAGDLILGAYDRGQESLLVFSTNKCVKIGTK